MLNQPQCLIPLIPYPSWHVRLLEKEFYSFAHVLLPLKVHSPEKSSKLR